MTFLGWAKSPRCRLCGKEHPPEKITLSEGNPSKATTAIPLPLLSGN